jgi:hypothetical protein
MRQGTTPKHTFTLPFDTEDVAKVRVLYAQNDKLKIVKTEADAEMDGNAVSVTLTQEETFLLNPAFDTEIQIRVLTHNGEALGSDPITVDTEKCLHDEVL